MSPDRIDSDTATLSLWTRVFPEAVFEPGNPPVAQIRYQDPMQIAQCENLLSNYKLELNSFRRARAYTGTFLTSGGVAMLIGAGIGGPEGGTFIAGGLVSWWLTSKLVIKMESLREDLNAIGQEFRNKCTEPWTPPVRELAPRPAPKMVARTEDSESVGAWIGQHAKGIGYGLIAAACAAVTAALVADDATGFGTLDDALIPSVGAAAVHFAQESANHLGFKFLDSSLNIL